jgi:hypothetical protein
MQAVFLCVRGIFTSDSEQVIRSRNAFDLYSRDSTLESRLRH